jgi:peroxiredoxin
LTQVRVPFHSSIIFPSQIKITILIYKPKESTIHVGDTLPSFDLTDAVGKPVSSADLLAKGPILITFYRGSWCPFCNLALKALQKHLDEFQAKGVSLVAISPELPDTALSTREKNELKFQVLSDVGHKYARQLGIVWQMPDNLRPVFEKLGHDLITRNGDDSFEVPIPATLLVDGKGVVKKTYIEPEYTKRVEPDTVLEWINAL